MTIVNRRNALLGWTFFKLVKAAVKWKARELSPGTVEGKRRPNRSAIFIGLAAVVGALLFWRRGRGEGETEPNA
jgi:hypothetical protein